MRNFSMKKFGTPMRRRAGRRERDRRVVERRRAVGVARRVGLVDLLVVLPRPAPRARRERLGVRVERSAAGLGRRRLRAACRPCPRARAGPARRRRARRVAAGAGAGVRSGSASASVGRRRRAVGRGGGVGVGVATGPRSAIDCTGAGRPGISIDSTERAGRHVDGQRERLARDQRDGDAVQLGGGGHDEHAEHGGGGERDDQLPSSHWVMRVPLSRSIGALHRPVRRFLRPEGVAAPYWSNIAVAIQERLNAGRIAPFLASF